MPVFAENKRVYFDYEILEKTEAGLELLGWEVKSIRGKKVSLSGSRVIMRGGEAFLIGHTVSPAQPKNVSSEYDTQRTIKILLTKKEIKYFIGKTHERGFALVPINIHSKGRKIKLEIGLARGKKKYEKRDKIKKRETEKNMRRLMKE
ncbi:MAG: SsrA-binding protein [Candidatus Terrybacteria bacterium CG10_big_fil_rev_8_21_14_0_10_41_10]|uniref:SsrA-binding protein n=1 Tax=Candidatus Terrybacteria bacterium CG10_big_fil_rev_8_21_14_0_10_41_10 TaxID=1975026 RepID=A0A2M8LAD7_9BACT|nr:MAG: SsrA-binding protein [Candidatus Terrybacteria bacterium CG10_big_fil_rev_8_21_14_0_10_41_10]